MANYETWMKEMWDVIGNRPLRDIVLPACHNAGVSRFSHVFPPGGVTDCSTRAQEFTILEQLNRGARCFEMRPALWSVEKKWYLHHGTIKFQKLLGAFGELLEAALNDISTFARKNSQELIILQFSHYLYVPKVIESLDVRDCNYEEKNAVLDMVKNILKDVIHKSSDSRISLADRTPEELVSGGRNVICVFEEMTAMASPEDGIFSVGGNLNTKYTPGLAVSKDKQVNCACVFMDDDTNVLRFVTSRAGGNDWSQPSSMHGQSSKRGPALATGPDGTLYAVFVANDNTNRLLLSKSTDNGKTWSDNTPLPDHFAVSDPSMVVGNDGTLYVLYLSGREGKEITLARSRDGGATWAKAEEIKQASSKPPSLAIDPAGTLHVVFVAHKSKELLWTKLPENTSEWSEQKKLEQATDMAPSVVADSNGTLYTLFASNDPNQDLLLTTLEKGASKWSKQRSIGGATKMSPRLTIDGDNTLYALYIAKNETNSLLLAKSTDRGESWGGSVAVTAPSNFATVSDYADSHEVGKVMTFEKGRLCCYRPRPGVLYGMSWLGTWHPPAADSPCLKDMADVLRERLLPAMEEWVKDGVITSTRRPNLIGVDWYNEGVMKAVEYLNRVLR